MISDTFGQGQFWTRTAPEHYWAKGGPDPELLKSSFFDFFYIIFNTFYIFLIFFYIFLYFAMSFCSSRFGCWGVVGHFGAKTAPSAHQGTSRPAFFSFAGGQLVFLCLLCF